MSNSFLIYGANGYTGELTARAAVERGLRPILAGRNAASVSALARALGLEHRIADLNDAVALHHLLEGVAVVLHCAGPFMSTSRPMADACLRNHVHYLDITGEIGVFEALAARDAEARRVGVMLLPGAGFDVVPSDCLAAHLKRRLPGAVRLYLGIRALGTMSRGTATTAINSLARGDGGLVRQDGALTKVPLGWRTRAIDFGKGDRMAVTVPWGDVSTAYYSTDIPNIEVYMTFPAATINAMKAGRYLGWLIRVPGAKDLLIAQNPPGCARPDRGATGQRVEPVVGTRRRRTRQPRGEPDADTGRLRADRSGLTADRREGLGR